MQRPVRDGTRTSAARLWAPLARFIDAEARIGKWAEQRRSTLVLYEFTRFGLKQGWACLFGGLLLALLIGTHLAYPKGSWLARYDFLFLAALLIQGGMLAFRLETWEEAKVILIFHVVGTAMELFKTGVGSWVYPEPSLFRIGGVPLFSGFMYAAVGSYIARAWRLFDFQFTRHPPLWTLAALSAGIYVNFFAHHYVADMRLVLFALAALLFGPAVIHYKIWRVHRSMPLVVGLGLVALFIWFAENIGTFAKAWQYPHQKAAWEMVPATKLGAWFLLMIISYTLVAAVHGIQAYRRPASQSAATVESEGSDEISASSSIRETP
jgi:uncharacterized membrane protein YoaT (DUF817 family)